MAASSRSLQPFGKVRLVHEETLAPIAVVGGVHGQTPRFMNILVAADGSRHSLLALQVAADLAESQNARLTLLTPIVRPLETCLLGLAQAAGAACLEDSEQAAAKISRAACQRVPDDVCVTALLSRQPIRSGLLTQIETGVHDLVVMGSRRHRRRGAGELGAVARYVVRRSAVPVMIVRAGPRGDDHATSDGYRVTLVRGQL